MSDIMLSYQPEDEIPSPATRVILARIEGTDIQRCVKMWKPWKDDLYDLRDEGQRTSYLLEGLNFNRRFAKRVYLGVALLKDFDQNSRRIRLGPLIKRPQIRSLKPGEYALLMRLLDTDWRLDSQLHPDRLGTKSGMEFLAQSIAHMHKQLEGAPNGAGNTEAILEKLKLNTDRFMDFLEENVPNDEKNREYKEACKKLDNGASKYHTLFEERFDGGYVKRCHGDLKATNLWVVPRKFLCINLGWFSQQLSFSTQLYILDCIDFNARFCHIDTLSDVAMLAVDIEMRLAHMPNMDPDWRYGQEMAYHFLTTYLHEAGEQGSTVWPLLEYYMTEKAMVCAYISKDYDEAPDLASRYLEVFLHHAKRLRVNAEQL